MKIIRIFVVLVLVFASCEDAPKNPSEQERAEESNAVLTENTQKNPETDENTAASTTLTGTFIRKDVDTATQECNCNCVEIDFQDATVLCLDTKSGLSIFARFEKVSDSEVHVYYVQPKNTDNINDEKIPWGQFDTTVPIAVVSYSGSGAFDMDWKGFSINREIAADYAIYGKKNLEGSYIKKH